MRQGPRTADPGTVSRTGDIRGDVAIGSIRESPLRHCNDSFDLRQQRTIYKKESVMMKYGFVSHLGMYTRCKTAQGQYDPRKDRKFHDECELMLENSENDNNRPGVFGVLTP